MKRFLRSSLICLFVAGGLVLAGWMKGLRIDSTATWYNPSSWRLHFERRATTRFQISPPRTGIAPGNSSGPALPWQKYEMDSILAEDCLTSVVKSCRLHSRWNVSESDAVNRLRERIDVKLEKGTDIITLTAWSAAEDEAAELANAVRDAYAGGRIKQERELVTRLIQSIDPKIAAQTSVTPAAVRSPVEILEEAKPGAPR